MKRNVNLFRLNASYLFPEVNLRKRAFLERHPDAPLISLGIGDTTEPIPGSIVGSLVKSAQGLGTREGYSGYGPEQGLKPLREKIANVHYQGLVESDEVFVSDGAKSDLARLQVLFGGDISVAVQDPAYPVYVDGSLIQGVKEVIYLPCTPENNFFPDLAKAKSADLFYFCSPNNPTGATFSRTQLKMLVDFAKENRALIVFDSAYAPFIQDQKLPKSIYEIEGAKEVAIEVNSFSKLAGFTGVRLGWTIIPKELRYEDGGSLHADWNRITSTLFNGASNIAQAGGFAVLEEAGLQEVAGLCRIYMENAKLIKSVFQKLDCEVYGGENAPYLWVRFRGQKSWDIFNRFLNDYHIITTPGSGFGPSGEGFIRLTAFGNRDSIQEALHRIVL